MAGHAGRCMEHGDSHGERRLSLQPDELVLEPLLAGDDHRHLRDYFRDSSVSIHPDSHTFPPAMVMGPGNSPADIAVPDLDPERICVKKRKRCCGISSRCKASESSDRDQPCALVARLSRPARKGSSSGTHPRSNRGGSSDGSFFAFLPAALLHGCGFDLFVAREGSSGFRKRDGSRGLEGLRPKVALWHSGLGARRRDLCGSSLSAALRGTGPAGLCPSFDAQGLRETKLRSS